MVARSLYEISGALICSVHAHGHFMPFSNGVLDMRAKFVVVCVVFLSGNLKQMF